MTINKTISKNSQKKTKTIRKYKKIKSVPKKPSPSKSSPKSSPKKTDTLDIIILRVNGMNWLTKNIAYRRSTGTSNVYCNGIINTNDLWLPTFGIVTQERLEEWSKHTKLRTLIHPGYITKMESIFPTSFTKQTNFIVNSIIGYERQSKMVKGITDQFLAFSYLYELNQKDGMIICLFRDIFPHYFVNWLQLQWSALIGGSFWQQSGLPEIREFILNYRINPRINAVWKLEKLEKPMDQIDIVRDRVTIEENNINSYMEDNEAFLHEYDEEIVKKLGI